MKPAILSTILTILSSVEGLRVRNETTNPYFDTVSKYLESIQDDLWPINKEIHSNPELGWKEEKAHKLLTDFLESQDGWSVTRSAYNVSTAFIAVFEGNGDGPIVSFNAEYDALEGLGHACGHNLIATASLGAALATANILREGKLPGKVILFGTPAEESYGGKITLLDAGAFKDHNIDVSIMAHPSIADSPYAITTSTDRFDVEYYGKEAHASDRPYDGINAQDALVLAYNAISVLRQQSLSTDQIHGIITSGGSRINVIPNKATGSFQIRSRNETSLETWTKRILPCFEAGALATGAKLNLTMRPNGYSNMVTNNIMAASFASWASDLGVIFEDPVIDKLKNPSGSTDQGDVSHNFPAIHPYFAITNEDGSLPATGMHTAAFEVAAGSRAAFERAVRASKGLAGVAVDVLTKDGLLDEIKREFEDAELSKRWARAMVDASARLVIAN